MLVALYAFYILRKIMFAFNFIFKPVRAYSSTVLSVPVLVWGHAVAQSVEALRHKSEGRGFDYRRCHWNFSLT